MSRARGRRTTILRSDAAEIAALCSAARAAHRIAELFDLGVTVAEAETLLLGYQRAPDPLFEPVKRSACARWSTPAPDEGDDRRFVDIRAMCEMAGEPHRAAEMIERDMPKREVARLLNLDAGLARPIDVAPFPSLLSGEDFEIPRTVSEQSR